MADIELIIGKVEEKEEYIRPILLRSLARSKNDYGDIDYANYLGEIGRFLKTYFSESNLQFYKRYHPYHLIHDHVLDYWSPSASDPMEIPVDGVDFEHWCASQLEALGWATRVSQASGDQGIDIEAFRDGIAVAIQCKRYSQPIGNKAVQEAYTGMVHYGAKLAVVIGTGGFTRQAVQLATNTGVILIDAENIDSFDELIGIA